jgi:hypothetical protein
MQTKESAMLNRVFVVLLFALSFTASADEMLQVPSPETGLFSSSEPTKVMLWDEPTDKSVVAFFPGGDGSWKMDFVWRRERRTGISKTVVLIPNTAGAFVNSPYSLGTTYGATGRFTDGHIQRMITALEAIRDKTHKPIWVYGHSNGAISAFEVYAQLQRENKTDLIKGIIVSGARDIIRIPDAVAVPVLFIHHQADACADTPYWSAKRNYEKVKLRSTNRTEFATVTTYIPPAGNPCLSGVHMFDNDYDELASIINKFINQ